jgi:hypothetical protein
LFSELKRGQAVAMSRRIRICGILIETLPDHQQAFAVAVPAVSEDIDVGRERYVISRYLPEEMKLVGSESHILAAARDHICLCLGIVFRRTGVQDIPHIVLSFENAERCGLSWQFPPAQASRMKARTAPALAQRSL